MHISFDLYPEYLRQFERAPDLSKAYSLTYDIHAMRNYEYRNEGGKQIGPFPQVRKEGSLSLTCAAPETNSSLRSMNVTHIRSWSTWTDQDHASKQTIKAKIEYAADALGSLGEWELSYRSDPILPVKTYRYNPFGPMYQRGTRRGLEVEIRNGGSARLQRYKASHDVVSFYTLIERLQTGAVEPGPVDFLDDLSMFRPNMELTPLPDQRIEVEGTKTNLHGYALVGPAFLPLYFWQDAQNNVLAAIGRNVAYTLTGIQS